MDVALLLHLAAQKAQISLLLLGHPLNHQAFSRLLQQGPHLSPRLLENPVGQPLETQHIHI